jgi:hypothetical protein
MKKLVIVCTLAAFISTNVFSMFVVTLSPRHVLKHKKPKNFCHNKIFDYEALILQTMEKNKRLEKENKLLKIKLASLLGQNNTLELSETERTIYFRSKEDRLSNGGKHHGDE